MKKKILAITMIGLLLASGLAMVACGTTGGGRMSFTPGTYTASAMGYIGPVSVEVRVSSNRITDVRVTAHNDTFGLAEWPIELIPAMIVEHQSLAVDVVTGVTITSLAIINAVEDSLRQAGADVAALYRPIRRPRVRDQTLTADVIIVGGGGAGMSAAVTAIEEGASVILIEKAGFLGGNTIVSGGAFNTSFPEKQNYFPVDRAVHVEVTNALAERPVNEQHRVLQERVRVEFEAFQRTDRTLFDSPSWHALQTWEGGDRLGNLNLVQVMTNNSQSAKEWLMSLGVEFDVNPRQAVGALWMRTMRPEPPAGVTMRNGAPLFIAFRAFLDRQNRYTQFMETTATGLIIEGGRVVGVNAVHRDGSKLILRANNGVILATGGFAGNVELRVRYAQGEKWPNLGPSVNTTNVGTVRGDGIFMARDAGAQLIDMDQIQLLQTCNPQTGYVMDFAFRIIGNTIYVNQEGRRFVREDGRRDDISIAAINQTGSLFHVIIGSDGVPNPDTYFTLDGRSVTFMVENNLSGFVKADTLKGLAIAIGVDPNNLVEAVKEFNSHVDSQTPDRFGRVLFGRKIENGPFFSQPRAPATHHTMGGVRIDEHARALRADGSPIPGLYAAGEVTGGIHGANRLGANAITDILVFGRIAGRSAAARR